MKTRFFGWHPDYPDHRDLKLGSVEIRTMLERSGKKARAQETEVPGRVDLRQWFSPVEDQGELGSCTANAGAGMFEYFQVRAHGKHIDCSRLFIYKTTRDLLGMRGDTGAYLRTTMKAMALFGAPPEKMWPYDVRKFDKEPSAFLYQAASNFQAMQYYRLDSRDPRATLVNVKESLAAGMPVMFGFSVFDNLDDEQGLFPMPDRRSGFLGGHAVVASGYDDEKEVGSEKGALLLRNSWGTEVGESGYYWMPYGYVTEGLAEDFWSLVDAEFIDTELFE